VAQVVKYFYLRCHRILLHCVHHRFTVSRKVYIILFEAPHRAAN